MTDEPVSPNNRAKLNAIALGDLIRTILFETPVEGYGPHLARNATTLAKSIGDDDEIPLTASSARSAISAMVGGKRAATDELRRGLVRYVQSLGLDKTNEGESNKFKSREVKLIVRLEAAMDNLQYQLTRAAMETISNQPSISDMYAKAEVMFTIAPGYLPLGAGNRIDPAGDAIRRRTTLFALRSIRGFESMAQRRGPKRVLCFADRICVGEYWRNMFRMVVTGDPDIPANERSRLPLEEALNKMRLFEEYESVRTYVIGEYRTLAPIIVIDPHLADTVVCNVYHEGLAAITSIVPAPYVERWKRFYRAILSGDEGERVPFSDYEQWLRHEYDYIPD